MRDLQYDLDLARWASSGYEPSWKQQVGANTLLKQHPEVQAGKALRVDDAGHRSSLRGRRKRLCAQGIVPWMVGGFNRSTACVLPDGSPLDASIPEAVRARADAQPVDHADVEEVREITEGKSE